MYTITDLTKNGVSIVLGSYNRNNFIKLTIQSIRKEFENGKIPYEIIVVDGGSSDGTIPWIIQQKDIITIIQHNRGIWNNLPLIRKSWGYFMNLGFRSARGKYICMLSDDCLVVPGAITTGYDLFEKKMEEGEKVGAIAFYWREWPIFNEYMIHEFFGTINVNHGLYLRTALEEIDYADEITYQFYSGDVDITYNLVNAGYSVISSENSYIEHFSHTNLKTRRENITLQEQDNIAFLQKWKSLPHLEGVTCSEGYKQKFKYYSDPTNTVKLYYPYVRLYRIGLTIVNIREYIKDLIGETRSSKLGLHTFTGMPKDSVSLWSKILNLIF